MTQREFERDHRAQGQAAKMGPLEIVLLECGLDSSDRTGETKRAGRIAVARLVDRENVKLGSQGVQLRLPGSRARPQTM